MNHLARTLLTLLLALACALTDLPAQGAWSRQNDLPGFGIAGRVLHLGTWRNELIAGTYRTPWRDGDRLEHIARFDGVRWYALGTGVSGPVRASLEFQGDLYVGGEFTYAGGQPAGFVARWDGSAWHPVGAGFDGPVWAFCEHQGALYAAGEFGNSGATATAGIARWNGAAWQPVGGGMQWGLGVYHVGHALVSDGQDLYVGGSFDRIGNVPASHVARWDGSAWHALGTGINNYGFGFVRALALHQGVLYVGGGFGQAGGVAADNIAAWDGTNWSQVGAGVQGTIYGAIVWDLDVFNGELYVGGSFLLSGSTTLQRVARWDDTALQPIGGVSVAETNPPSVISMTTWNGRLYCGGEFHFAEPSPLAAEVAVYHITAYDGAVWHQAGEGYGIENEVHVFGRYQGDLVAGGRFHAAGGSQAACLARFDGDDWRYFGTFDGLVLGITEHNGELWVAGEFYRVDGITANGVARWDGTSWHAVGNGPSLYRANSIASYQGMIHVGTTGSPRRWNGSTWELFTPPITGIITAMHVHAGVLYMGGSTPFHAGAPNVFAWDGVNLSVPGGGVDGIVESLGSFGGELIVGGRFANAGGVPARCIARWNGSSWSTFGTGIQGATVAAITSFGGRLTIGGDFSQQQGANADYVASWDGSQWQPIGPSAPDGAVFALLGDDARGELHVGGWYLQNGAQDDGYYSLWQDTPTWTDLGNALGTTRRTPHLLGAGTTLPGARLRWRLSSAPENGLAAFVFGLQRVDQPLLGITLVPRTDAVSIAGLDGIGNATASLQWPGLPGLSLWAQALIADPAAPQGISASNALRLQSH
ncbi:MAG: hypothetical protein KDE27_22730 [Planctomycetes bacterium]|nr:hypothetical protein [Planctomycetota bacterium]